MKNLFRHYQGLPKSIYALFAAQIVNALGNLVYPFLTFFLVQKLDYSPAAAGRFILIASVAFVPGSLIGGKMADTWGRKKILIIAQGLAGLMFLPCAFLGESPLVPWFIVGANLFGGAANPTHEAITADLTTSSQRQAAFSLLYLGHNIGFSLGPLIAGFLFLHALPLLFLGDAVTTALALILVFFFVPETKPSEESMASHGHDDEHQEERAEEGSLAAALLKRPRLVIFTLISMVLYIVYSQFTFSLPLQMEASYPEKGPFFFGVLMTVNALVVIFLTTPLMAFTKKLKPLKSIALGTLLFAVGFGVIAAAGNLGLFIAATVFWTAGEILQATNTNVYISANTPISHRGRFNAVLPIIMGSGFALGPLLMGSYIDRFSVELVWPLMAGISLVMIPSLLVLQKNKHH